jgi:hypothetical protein
VTWLISLVLAVLVVRWLDRKPWFHAEGLNSPRRLQNVCESGMEDGWPVE